MTGGARALALGVGALALTAGAVIQIDGHGGWGLIAIGALICASTLAERRYRPSHEPSGPGWQRTGEREYDSESGTVREVWFDPLTGERRYVPLSDRPETLPRN